MRLIGRLLGLGLMVLVAACGATGPGPSSVAAIDAAGPWQLAAGTVDGVRFLIVDDAPVTMTVDGAQITGRSGCNQYGGEFIVEGESVRVVLTSMTEMACPEPAMAVEAAFGAAVARITGGTREGDRLILSGPDVELIFDRPTGE
jgi:heat shock protein HslJ